MPRRQKHRRTLSEIFTLGRDIGSDNVLLNDSELGAVLTGTDKQPLAAGTISNQRFCGRLTTPVVRTTREPLTRLSDAVAFRDKKTRAVA